MPSGNGWTGAKKPRKEASKNSKSLMKKLAASLVEAQLKRAAISEAQESRSSSHQDL